MVTGIAIGDDGGLFQVDGAEILFVCLHAYDHTPSSFQRVAEVIREQYPRSDIYAPRMPVALLSWADPNTIADDILRAISEIAAIEKHDRIVFVGHSLGAVLARKIWALAHGATPFATIDPNLAKPWASKIDRIVLLAALNRGWNVSSALDPMTRLGWRLGSAWTNLSRYFLGRDPMIAGFRRGAPFLTTVRLQCLAIAASLGAKQPVIVQMLGTADDYVAPTDNLDMATGLDFFYLEVPEATHRGIVNLSEGSGSAEATFRLAISGNPEVLQERSLKPVDVYDIYDDAYDDQDTTGLPQSGFDVDHVVFVIHGIRDRGFWTRRIARQVKQQARMGKKKCRAVTSTYGYFPMGPFLVPWVRDRKVEWLLDQYVTAKSLYPKADFSYIGHSNGTYLLAKALEVCEAIKFENIVFAGSVVRTGFMWSQLCPGQVGRVLNYVATDDKVVAIFPNGLERMRLQDLGGAGQYGFTDRMVTNFMRVDGGHGAALGPDRWREMAEFVLGAAPPSSGKIEPTGTAKLLGFLAPLIWLILVAGVLGLGTFILWGAGHPAWIVALVFVLYLAFVRMVLTRA